MLKNLFMAKKQVKMQVAASSGTSCGSGDGNKINVAASCGTACGAGDK